MAGAIHPTAVIAAGAELAADVQVGAYAVIGAGVRIGPGTIVGPHTVIEGLTSIGEGNFGGSHGRKVARVAGEVKFLIL